MSEPHAVLYVEDEFLLREVFTVILEDAGFEVVTAANGAAAFVAMNESGEPFCAMVTDINLGDGPDGWAVAKRGRELDHTLPVVYVTGASSHQWESEGVPRSLLLKKPVTPDQILEAVRSILHLGD